MHNNTPTPEEIEEALAGLWQMEAEMSIIIAGFAAERELLYGDLYASKKRGEETDWILGEMMGLNRAAAMMTPLDVENTQS